MEVNSDHVESIEEMDEEFYSGEEITYLELEVKLENLDRKRNIKTEVFEEKNNFEPLQIIGDKRENQDTSNLENENKKIKEEFVVFEESDYKEEHQEIEEINLDDLNNQVIKVTFPREYKTRFTVSEMFVLSLLKVV